MTRICKLCGSTLSDESAFCPRCGTRLTKEESPEFSLPVLETPKVPEIQEPPVAESTDEGIPATPIIKPKRRIPKKWLAIGGGVLGLLVILVVVAFLFRPNPGIAVQKYEDFLNGDYGVMTDLAPIEHWEYYAMVNRTTVDEYVDTRLAEAEQNLPVKLDQWKDIYGDDLEIRLDIVDSVRMEDDDTEDLADILDEEYGIDADQVKAAYDLILRITYKGSKDVDILAGYAVALQIGSEWYLLRYHQIGDSGIATFITRFYIGELLYY